MWDLPCGMPSCEKVKSLKNKYSWFFSDRRDIPELEPESDSSVEETYPLLREFKDSQEVTDPVLRNIDANMVQQLNDDRERSDQRSRKFEGLLVLALQAIQRLEARMQESDASKRRGEPKKAPLVLMEDNLTKV